MEQSSLIRGRRRQCYGKCCLRGSSSHDRPFCVTRTTAVPRQFGGGRQHAVPTTVRSVESGKERAVLHRARSHLRQKGGGSIRAQAFGMKKNFHVEFT